ncbi:Gfo/Idh/MocA family oxidoreductase [Planktomarina temperata]|nr:Gfo/Idh/MocA family oxidoreductase [Planktomarina temperata]
MIYIIGSGYMATEYSKVLTSLNLDYTVLGNGERSCEKFKVTTGKISLTYGIEKIKSFNNNDALIVAVPAIKLCSVTRSLLRKGAKKILLEKPGALSSNDLFLLKEAAEEADAKILVGYNRRFYSSVIQALKIIKEDGGIISCSFDFTEWSDEIISLGKNQLELDTWVIANSSHVIDLAFYLIGSPRSLSSNTTGCLDWHACASTFAGSGISENGILFNYQANWDSAGRWALELHTKLRKLIFRPLEELKMITRGSLEETIVESNFVDLDKSFKPGLYRQTKAFLDSDFKILKSIDQQVSFLEICEKIAGYKRLTDE